MGQFDTVLDQVWGLVGDFGGPGGNLGASWKVVKMRKNHAGVSAKNPCAGRMQGSKIGVCAGVRFQVPSSVHGSIQGLNLTQDGST